MFQPDPACRRVFLLPSNFTGDEVFSVRSPSIPKAARSGPELNYQQPFTFLPSFGKNIGLLANYTFIKSKIKYLPRHQQRPIRPTCSTCRRAPGMPRCTTTTAL